MKKKGRIKRALIIILIVVLAIVLTLGVACFVYVKSITKEKLDMSLFSFDRANSVTKIYIQREGEWVEWQEERILGDKNFEFVSIENIPQNLINAFVAIEDKRFYSHDGVDWYRSLGAMANYFLNFGGKFG